MDETTLTLTIGTALAGLSALVYFRTLSRRQDERSQQSTTTAGTRQSNNELSSSSTEKRSSQNSSTAAKGSAHPRDVWEERRQRGIVAASSHGSKGASTEKPFSSSYYYAHNNSNAAGGYKDGLTMEDFTMNGPRLLSRGGKPVEEDAPPIPEDDRIVAAGEQSPENIQSPETSSLRPRRTIAISKYLWDDPGDSAGKATIRIDQLPPTQPGDSPHVEWSVARSRVTSVQTELRNKGMSLLVETTDGVDYTLHIPTFYGDVTSVDHVNKVKRLVVRIQKKRGMFSSKNTQSWPHPHKKVD